MDQWRLDTQRAFRQIFRNPGFSVVAILSLAIGVGATTTIFSLANALLLRPLPVRDQGRLRYVYAVNSDGTDFHSFSNPLFRALRADTRTLDGLAAFDNAAMSVATDGEASLALGMTVSDNYFRVLGTSPQQGRFFVPAEDSIPMANPVAVVGYRFWQERMNGAADAVGRTIRVNGHPFVVIGIARADFNGTVPFVSTDVWIPIMMTPVLHPDFPLGNWQYVSFQLIGRVADGEDNAAAARDIDAVAHRRSAEVPGAPDIGASLHPLTLLPTQILGGAALFMGMLLTFTGLILAVAGSNVASMLIARSIRRRREFAICAALGASRARLARQLVMESVALFVLATPLAVLLALAATRAIQAFRPPVGFPIAVALPLDARVVAFTSGVVLLASLAVGTFPALRASRHAMQAGLGEGTRGTPRSRLWNALVAGQVAFAVLLLTGAGLLVRALEHASSLTAGLDRHGVYLAATDLEMRHYTPDAGLAALEQWRSRVAALPGVEGAAFARVVPLGLDNSTTGFIIDGRELPKDASPYIDSDFNAVSPGFFDVMRIPMVAGRAFSAADVSGSPPVAIVSAVVAARYFGDPAGAVGRTIRFDVKDTTRTRIVGVAADIKVRSLGEATRAYVYQPLAQTRPHGVTLLTRTSGEPAGAAAGIRAALAEVDPDLPLESMMTFEEHLGLSLIPQRLAGLVAGLLGIVGLLLVAIGLAGVVSYAVSQRTREIGIRVAVGASPSSIVRLMTRLGLRLAAIGLPLGLIAGLAAAQAMRPFLLGVSATDPLTFTAAAGVMLVIVSVACLIPARRASRVDPVVALRAD